MSGKKQKFSGKLVASGSGGAWTFMAIPFDVKEVFGTRARVPVSGTINGVAFRNSLMPQGDGTHRMMVKRELQIAAGAQPGDVVQVVLQRDDEPRTVDVPPELEKALAKNAVASRAFAARAYSHKKEYVDWILGAKQAETKERRIAKVVETLAVGKKRQ